MDMRRPNQKRLAFLSAMLPVIAFAIFTASPAMSNEVPPDEGGGTNCVYGGLQYSPGACIDNCTFSNKQKCKSDGTWSSCQSC
jgi:hypothetical protein